MLGSSFSLKDFLFMAMSLSYRADIRPEPIRVKVSNIIESAGMLLHEIYRPLLHELDYIEQQAGAYRDTRPDELKKKAHRRARWYLWKEKFNGNYRKALWRNYHTYKHPLSYVYSKIHDEMAKRIKFNVLEKLSGSILIKNSIRDNIDELAGLLGSKIDAFQGTRVKKIGKDRYKAILDLGSENRTLIIQSDKHFERIQAAQEAGLGPAILFADRLRGIIFIEDRDSPMRQMVNGLV